MKRSREATSGEFDLSKDNLSADLKKIAVAKHGDVPVADRCTVLRATNIGPDPFKFALNLFNQHILKKMDDMRKGIKSDVESTSANNTTASTQKKKVFGKPIVVVPQSFTTMILSQTEIYLLSLRNYYGLKFDRNFSVSSIKALLSLILTRGRR